MGNYEKIVDASNEDKNCSKLTCITLYTKNGNET